MDNVDNNFSKDTVSVIGMHCSACARTIERVVAEIPGVEEISVNAMSGQAAISRRPGSDFFDEANRRLKPLGYGLVAPQAGNDVFARWQENKKQRQADLRAQKKRLLFLVPLASLLLVAMLGQIVASKINPNIIIVPMDVMNTLAFLASIAVLSLAGQPFLRGLWLFLRGKDANMDTLIGLGTSVAFIYSSLIFLSPGLRLALRLPEAYFFDVVVVVITFVYLGKYLEHKTKAKAGEAIEKLIGLQAKTAVAIREGVEQEIPIEELRPGEIIRVKAGEKIPSDGLIVSGSAHLDEAMVSGEPLPRHKKAGDKVIGGTINQDGVLEIQVTSSLSDSFLVRVIEAVDAAQQSKAPSQKLADQVSRIFVPAVIAIAVATLFAWLAIGSRSLGWEQALGLGLACFISVLAIACPCALGLATPAAMMAGIGAGSRKGILIKSAEAIEELAKADTIVFDKTGTVTSGKPAVAGMKIISPSYKETDVLAIAAALEGGSTHPIARAVIEASRRAGSPVLAASKLAVIAGSGAKGEIGGKTFFIGKLKDHDQKNIDGPETLIGLYESEALVAMLKIADTIKPEAARTISELKRQGLATIMLSGDRQEAAEKVASGLGIDKVIGGVSPLEKAAYVKSLKEKDMRVAMVGDGINDSVALAEANVGIAMDTGSDIALESAQAALLRGDLELLPLSIRIARKTVRTMKQNLFWAFFYNVVAIPIAAGLFFPLFGWLLSPEIAALAMSLSSVTVVSNALALKRRFA